MGDMGDIYNSMNAYKKEKKQDNYKKSLLILDEKLIPYKKLSESHFRIGDFDFWPSTGLFINIKSKKRRRGVFNLIKALTKESK